MKKIQEWGMKEFFFLANMLLVVSVLIGDIFYIEYGGLWLKGITSAGFVLIGTLNLVYLILNKHKDIKFPCIMLTGLVFAMLGDIVLNLHFISGAILFAIGHVFFFVAYCFLSKFKWIDLAYGAGLFVPSMLFIVLAPIFDFDGALMEIVCVVYALIISCMVGKAISNLVKERSLINILILVGSALFFFSDLMLLLNVFADLPRICDILCLATYYPAECVLAFTIFIHKDKEKTAIAKPAKQKPELAKENKTNNNKPTSKPTKQEVNEASKPAKQEAFKVKKTEKVVERPAKSTEVAKAKTPQKSQPAKTATTKTNAKNKVEEKPKLTPKQVSKTSQSEKKSNTANKKQTKKS